MVASSIHTRHPLMLMKNMARLYFPARRNQQPFRKSIGPRRRCASAHDSLRRPSILVLVGHVAIEPRQSQGAGPLAQRLELHNAHEPIARPPPPVVRRRYVLDLIVGPQLRVVAMPPDVAVDQAIVVGVVEANLEVAPRVIGQRGRQARHRPVKLRVHDRIARRRALRVHLIGDVPMRRRADKIDMARDGDPSHISRHGRRIGHDMMTRHGSKKATLIGRREQKSEDRAA